MKGTNPVTHQQQQAERMLLQELFFTVQGEGPYSGRRAVFVRLAHCNLRCYWCDTEFSSPAAELRPNELYLRVASECRAHQTRLVVITGGEPLLWPALVRLVLYLRRGGMTVQIETNGTVWIPGLEDSGAVIVCSPKTPELHPMIVRHATCWKYVLPDTGIGDDGLPNFSTQREGRYSPLYRPPHGDPRTVYVHPCDYGDALRNRQARFNTARSAMQHGYTAQVQLHKALQLP